MNFGKYVNKQHCRIWRVEYPLIAHEKLLHPQRATLFCSLFSGGVFFFENSVNNDIRYVNNINLMNMWCHQKGSTSYIANKTIQLQKTTTLTLIYHQNNVT